MDFSAIAQLFSNIIFFALHLGSPNLFPKPLSKKDEAIAVKKALNGDINARNLLIEHNLRLVVHIIKKYYANNSDQDDLISIGTIGLIKGINSFNPDKEVRLATYASRRIENAIHSLQLSLIRKLQRLNLFQKTGSCSVKSLTLSLDSFIKNHPTANNDGVRKTYLVSS